MVTVTGHNRLRRSSQPLKAVATLQSSTKTIRRPQTWIVITVGMAVMLLFSLEPPLVLESSNEHGSLPIPPLSRMHFYPGNRKEDVPSSTRPHRRIAQQPSLSTSPRFGMVPEASLRTSISRPVDTLHVEKDKASARTRTTIRTDVAPVTTAPTWGGFHVRPTIDRGDDDSVISTVVSSTLFTTSPPRVVYLGDLNGLWPGGGGPSFRLDNAMLSPLPPDHHPVHFDITSSKDVSDDITMAGPEIFPFEREFYEDCEPIVNPKVHPTCNHLHDLPMHDDHTALLSTKGSWRTAWTVNNDTAVLKVLQYARNFDSESFERQAMDVIISDLLTASPYVIDAYGFCGNSIIQEWAPSGGRDVVKSYDLRNRQRLKISRDLARGLADLQALQVIPHTSFVYKGKSLTRRHIPPSPQLVFSHNDINIANTVYSDSRKVIKWNDFNIGVFLRTRKGSNFTEACGAPVKFRADLWRSPEEVRNSSYVDLQYTDMYGFGNILYQVMSRHQPWTHKEPEGQLTVDQVAERKQQGRYPTIPDKILNTTSKDLQIMALATMSCYHPVPSKRLTAYEMAHALSFLYDRLQHKKPVPFSMLRELFLSK